MPLGVHAVQVPPPSPCPPPPAPSHSCSSSSSPSSSSSSSSSSSFCFSTFFLYLLHNKPTRLFPHSWLWLMVYFFMAVQVAGVLHKKSYVAMGAIAPAQVQWTQFASATLGRYCYAHPPLPPAQQPLNAAPAPIRHVALFSTQTLFNNPGGGSPGTVRTSWSWS